MTSLKAHGASELRQPHARGDAGDGHRDASRREPLCGRGDPCLRLGRHARAPLAALSKVTGAMRRVPRRLSRHVARLSGILAAPMSDALNYLLKARPEAMAAYFKFLKGAGKHLDPKDAQPHLGDHQGARADRERAAPVPHAGAAGRCLRRRGDRCAADNIPGVWASPKSSGRLTDLGHEPAGVPAGSASAHEPSWHDVARDGRNRRTARPPTLDCDGRSLFVYRKGARAARSTTAAARTRSPTSRISRSRERSSPVPSTSGRSTSRPAAASHNGDRPLNEYPHKVGEAPAGFLVAAATPRRAGRRYEIAW